MLLLNRKDVAICKDNDILFIFLDTYELFLKDCGMWRAWHGCGRCLGGLAGLDVLGRGRLGRLARGLWNGQRR